MNFYDGNNKLMAEISVTVVAGDTAHDIVYKITTAINGTGKFTAVASGTDLKIKALQNGRGWEKLNYSTYVNIGGNELWSPMIRGPKVTDKGVVEVTGGQVTWPNP